MGRAKLEHGFSSISFAGVLIGATLEINLVKAAYLKVTALNNTEKRIKYLEIDVCPTNKFGDTVDSSGNPGGKPYTFHMTDIGTGRSLYQKKKSMRTANPLWSNSSGNIQDLLVSRIKSHG